MNEVTAPRELLTRPQVLQRLKIGTTTLYELTKSGTLPSVKIGNRRLFVSDEIDAYIDSLVAESAGE